MKIDQLIRSKRKTVSLIIERDGTLIVRAPNRLALREIQRMVDSKSEWIARKRVDLVNRAEQAPPLVRTYQDGETFLYLGQQIPLRLVARPHKGLELVDSVFLLASADQPQAEQIFQDWYRQQARQVFTGRAQKFAPQLDVGYAHIRISSARTRWGSCSSRGTLNFTWRLVLASLDVIDYVVVHELAHLREPNHSARFWAIVEKHMPDYQTRRAWLQQHAGELSSHLEITS